MSPPDMDSIRIKDKEFGIFIPHERIMQAVEEVAASINKDLEGTNPLFICVLNGSFMFTADLLKNITIHVRLPLYVWPHIGEPLLPEH